MHIAYTYIQLFPTTHLSNWQLRQPTLERPVGMLLCPNLLSLCPPTVPLHWGRLLTRTQHPHPSGGRGLCASVGRVGSSGGQGGDRHTDVTFVHPLPDRWWDGETRVASDAGVTRQNTTGHGGDGHGGPLAPVQRVPHYIPSTVTASLPHSNSISPRITSSLSRQQVADLLCWWTIMQMPLTRGISGDGTGPCTP